MTCSLSAHRRRRCLSSGPTRLPSERTAAASLNSCTQTNKSVPAPAAVIIEESRFVVYCHGLCDGCTPNTELYGVHFLWLFIEAHHVLA